MGQRRDRLDGRTMNAEATRKINSLKKYRERCRREEFMLGFIKSGKMPYTPGIMSWITAKLGKKASQVTKSDIKALLAR